MSNVSLVYDGLLTKLNALFPAKSRIPNPYSLEQNIDNFLVDGFGLKVGPESPSEFVEYNSFTLARQFSVVLTSEMVSTASDTDVQDDISTNLLEDVYIARKMIFAPDRMGLAAVQKADIGSSSEITAVKVGQRKFLSIEFSFSIDINESF